MRALSINLDLLADLFIPCSWTLDEADRKIADNDELDDVYTFNSTTRVDVMATDDSLASRVWLKTPVSTIDLRSSDPLLIFNSRIKAS